MALGLGNSQDSVFFFTKIEVETPRVCPSLGSVPSCVQNRLRKASGHGKRLIAEIDLTHKELDHDHSRQA